MINLSDDDINLHGIYTLTELEKNKYHYPEIQPIKISLGIFLMIVMSILFLIWILGFPSLILSARKTSCCSPCSDACKDAGDDCCDVCFNCSMGFGRICPVCTTITIKEKYSKRINWFKWLFYFNLGFFK